MDCKEIREMYKLMFAEYPDIVTVKDLQAKSAASGWETPTKSPKSM